MLFYNDNKVNLKGPIDFNSKYNITTEEKDNIIELKYSKKPIFRDDDAMWNYFKVSIKKTTNERYYVYFNENTEDKKEITEEDVKGLLKILEEAKITNLMRKQKKSICMNYNKKITKKTVKKYLRKKKTISISSNIFLDLLELESSFIYSLKRIKTENK